MDQGSRRDRGTRKKRPGVKKRSDNKEAPWEAVKEKKHLLGAVGMETHEHTRVPRARRGIEDWGKDLTKE